MEQEAAFLAAIDADPFDDARRLVYADWLDERGEPNAAEFLRAELEVANDSTEANGAARAREQLWQAWAKIDRRRLHEFTQPNRMRANPTPYDAGWVFFADAGFRQPIQASSNASYVALPSVPANKLQGDFQFLSKPRKKHYATVPVNHHNQRCLAALLADPRREGVRLPLEYKKFMGDIDRDYAFGDLSPASNFRFPSEADPIRRVLQSNCVRIPFYWDYASLLSADLCVHSSGASCIVSCDRTWRYERNGLAATDVVNVIANSSRFAAPSVEAFVYRLAVEVKLCSRLSASPAGGETPDTLTESEAQAYLAHYRGR